MTISVGSFVLGFLTAAIIVALIGFWVVCKAVPSRPFK